RIDRELLEHGRRAVAAAVVDDQDLPRASAVFQHLDQLAMEFGQALRLVQGRQQNGEIEPLAHAGAPAYSSRAHRASAASPSAIGVDGTKPRSARMRDASARVRSGSPGGRASNRSRAATPSALSSRRIASSTSTCEPPPTL